MWQLSGLSWLPYSLQQEGLTLTLTLTLTLALTFTLTLTCSRRGCP